MECRDCGREYDPNKKVTGGYIYHCDLCSSETAQRYVGRTNEKNEGITVFTDNLEYWAKQIRRENAVGFNANLPVSNPVTESKKG